MFEPPVSTPTARMTVIAWSRSFWYCASVSVCCGATVTESPVCTPIGSTFSIEQTITTLSVWSRISSSSNSPQPITDSSTSTWPIGLAARPSATTWRYSVSVRAMPPPSPPIVKPGRTIAGRPISASARSASRIDLTAALAGTRRPGALHRGAEQLAVLGAADRVVVGADQLDAGSGSSVPSSVQLRGRG